MNIVKPFWLTARKPLKHIRDGDPNGVAESVTDQRIVLSNLSRFRHSAPSGPNSLSNLGDRSDVRHLAAPSSSTPAMSTQGHWRFFAQNGRFSSRGYANAPGTNGELSESLPRFYRALFSKGLSYG